VMTAPVHLPMYGKVKLRETTKEALLEFWEEVEQRTGLEIRYEEGVEQITRVGDGFDVESSLGKYRTRAIVLAIGRRGTPRKLGAPGEDLPHIVYRLVDAEQYRGQNVLIVGGGDSALEAATSLAALPETRAILSYRGDGFSRAKPKNREKVAEAVAAGELQLMLESNVKEITPSEARIEIDGRIESLAVDSVIVCAGGILPTGFLKSIGVAIETKHGSA
jgi:thioredoxin reductase (NADPH)